MGGKLWYRPRRESWFVLFLLLVFCCPCIVFNCGLDLMGYGEIELVTTLKAELYLFFEKRIWKLVEKPKEGSLT